MKRSLSCLLILCLSLPGSVYSAARDYLFASPGAPGAMAPPANDNCSGALALTVNADLNCGTTLNATTTDATATVPTLAACGGTADDDVWFSFVATGLSHRIKVSGGTQALYFQVFSGACGSLTSLLCSALIGAGSTGEAQVNGLTAGQTYYIRVYTSSNLVYTNFTICVGTPPAAPGNDACANATLLTVNADLNCGTTLNTTTTGATPTTPAITACGGTADDDVWYRFVATGPSHRIKVSGGTQALYFQVFSGACGSLTSLLCSALIGAGSSSEAQINGLTAGQTYYIRVYTSSSLVYTDFTICVGTPPAAPANDECANAIALTVNTDLNCGTVLNSTTTGGTPSTAPDCSLASEDDDVWYKFVATGPTHRVKITGASSDIAMQAFSGTCAGLAIIVCNNPSAGTLEQALYGLTVGQTYYIRVFTRENLVYSDFTICVGTPPAAPPNDECANATLLTVNTDLNCGTALNSTTTGGTPSTASDCSLASEDDDVWYKFVATEPTHRVKITGASSDIAMQAFSGTCAGLAIIVCNNPSAGTLEQALYGLTVGQTYYIRVFTRENLVYSDFTICVGTPPVAPANDECANAIALTLNPNLNCGTVLNTTTSGGTPSTAPDCSLASEDDDVWYKFVATGASHWIFVAGNTEPLAVQSFSGVCGSLVSLGCSNPGSSTVFQQLNSLTAGQTYYIRVFTRNNLTFSDFSICVGTPTAAPANDNCSGAILLTINAGTSCVDTLNATTSGATGSSPAIGGCSGTADEDVWFKFVAAGTSHVIRVTNATRPMTVQAFSGVCGTLSSKGCTSNAASGPAELLLSGLTAGQTYLVRVYTTPNQVYSDFTICVAAPPPPPANNECANATLLTVNPDLNCGTTLAATTANATQSLAGCTGTADDDVWFKFVATAASHRVKVSGLAVWAILQPYSGTCGNLTSFTCQFSTGSTSEYQMNGLTIGQTYYIRFYTYDNLVYTNFNICVGTPPPPPANDECANATLLTVNPDLNCTAVLSASTAGALQSQAACTGTADDDVWFKFVATSVSHRVKVTGITGWSVLQPFSGACGNLTSMTCQFSSSSSSEYQMNGLTVGQTYYIRFYSYENLVYINFDICINTPPVPPANDECANATLLTVNPDLNCTAVLSASTAGALQSQAACTGTADDDVWFKFVATSVSHRVKVTGITDWSVLQPFSGTCGNLTSMTCQFSSSSSSEYQMNGLTVGQTYYIRFYSYENLVNINFDICINTPPVPPANDECANATLLTVNPDLNCGTVLSATTTGATQSQAACSGTADDDVWFKFVATSVSHRVRVTGITGWSVLQPFSGTCGNLTSITCQFSTNATSEYQMNGLTVGQTYYVRFYTYDNLVATDFDICINTPPPPPANDECANATLLTVNPDLNCGTVLAASTSGATPSQSGCTGAADDDVWFKFVATAASHRVKVTGITGWSVLQPFSGTCGNLTSIICQFSTNATSQYQMNGLTPGETYFIRFYTYENLVYTDFTICIGTPPPPPANDECAGAIALIVNPAATCVDTLNATTAGALQSLAPCTGAASDDDVWFKFVAQTDSQTVSITNGTDALVLQIFSGNCNGLNALSCDYNAYGHPQRKLTGLTAGQTYYVRVYTSDAFVYSDFTICVSTPVAPVVLADIKMFLQGPYVAAAQQMHDSLRVKGLIPLTEQYTALTNFLHAGGGGGETTTPAVLAVTGANAIVDWVFLELRSATTPTQVLATRSALLQRDGDVVGVDGTSPVAFNVPAEQSYYLAVRHRNHLGVQLGAPKFYPSGVVVATDFRTLPPEGFYSYNGTNAAQKLVSGKYTLWAGNGRIDFQLKYNGSNNDRNSVLGIVGLNTPNATVPGYLVTDYNLDGVTKYNGSANDRNVLLGNVGITTPSAILNDQIAR